MGPKAADVALWENIASRDPWKPKNNKFWTALSDVVSVRKYDRILSQIDECIPMVPRGVLDDGVLITGQPTGLVK